MEKLLSIPILYLMLCIILPFAAPLTVHAAESVDWKYEYDSELYNFVADDNTEPQLTGYFYCTNRYGGDLEYLEELNTAYNLHLAIGVIGEEPAKNVQVHFDISDLDEVYHNRIGIQATISADNYDTITVTDWFSFYDADNCQLYLMLPITLVRNRADLASGISMADSLETTISLSDTSDGDIAPGVENICEVVIPCNFTSDPPIFTEANQPPQTRFNAITDNPIIGNEATNSAWVTDEAGNLVNSLAADHTYTAHLYVRVSGPTAATGVNIMSDPIDGQVINSRNTWNLNSYIEADNVRRFRHDVDYPISTDLRLSYVTGSLILHRDNQEDIALNPTSFFKDSYSSTGMQIGTAGLDGIILPGTESACEITYQFQTFDHAAEVAAEEADKEAERIKEEERQAEEAKKLAYSDQCSVWLTDENGRKSDSLITGETYTVHALIRIDGIGQAEGVRISNSDLAAIILDSSNRDLYLKLTSDNLEENTLTISIHRSRNIDEVLGLKYVSGSLQVQSAAGTYTLSDKDFFDYGTGCLIGFNGADGLIPSGKGSSIEITYQVKTTTGQSKISSNSGLKSGGLLRQPIFAIFLLIIVFLEFCCIIRMAFRPDNRLSRLVKRSRRFVKSVKTGFDFARADLRDGEKKLPASADTQTEQGPTESDDKA